MGHRNLDPVRRLPSQGQVQIALALLPKHLRESWTRMRKPWSQRDGEVGKLQDLKMDLEFSRSRRQTPPASAGRSCVLIATDSEQLRHFSPLQHPRRCTSPSLTNMDSVELEQEPSTSAPPSPLPNGQTDDASTINLEPVPRDPVDENYARSRTKSLEEHEGGEGEGESVEVNAAGAQGDAPPSSDAAGPPQVEPETTRPRTVHDDQISESLQDPQPAAPSSPPTPPAKPIPNPLNLPPRRESLRPSDRVVSGASTRDSIDSIDGRRVNGRGVKPRSIPSRPSSQASHRRSLTISKGHMSVVLISSALETIAASRDAKRSAPLKESVQRALDMVKLGEGGDRPREIFEPLRLACETRNEKLMIASLDCISKLISYSFFVEANPSHPQGLPSPPPSPGPNRNSLSSLSQGSAPPPSLVDLVVHTITSCHTESTPDTVSLQVVKALLALVLSPTTLVHQSSLLKAVRTVYNVFLLSNDPINQTVAQGGLTQMVNHVFTRCRLSGSPVRSDSTTTLSSRAGGVTSPTRGSLSSPRHSIPLPPLTPPSPVTHSNTESEDTHTTPAEGPSADTKPVSPQNVSTDSIPEPSINGSSDVNPDEAPAERPQGPV